MIYKLDARSCLARRFSGILICSGLFVVVDGGRVRAVLDLKAKLSLDLEQDLVKVDPRKPSYRKCLCESALDRASRERRAGVISYHDQHRWFAAGSAGHFDGNALKTWLSFA